MHKSGNRVSVTVEELFQMKEDSRLLGRFVVLCSAWIAATSFKQARKTGTTSSEWSAWLTVGLWKAVQNLDERAKGVGMVFQIALFDACKAHVAAYVNSAQKTEDACDSCNRDSEGNLEEILIPSMDENLSSLDFRDFMDNLKGQTSERDFTIIQKRLDGYTLEEIGEAVGVSKQGVDKIFKRHLSKLRQFA